MATALKSVYPARLQLLSGVIPAADFAVFGTTTIKLPLFGRSVAYLKIVAGAASVEYFGTESIPAQIDLDVGNAAVDCKFVAFIERSGTQNVNISVREFDSTP